MGLGWTSGKNDEEIIKTCRTSNAPDYSEDDNICTDDMPKLADDEMAWDDKFETDNKKKEE